MNSLQDNNQQAPLILTKPKKPFTWSPLFWAAASIVLFIAWYIKGYIVFTYLILAVICTFIIPIYKYIRWQAWDTNDKFMIENTLHHRIWKKVGIAEVRGGTKTGKSLLLILLAKHLKGKIWTNIPNRLAGTQILDLEIIQQIYQGNYPLGMLGKDNLLLIDDSWDFFNKRDLEKYNLTHRLSDIFYFLSETSKNNLKVIYVSKQGVKLPSAFSLLSANRTFTIKTKGGERFYVEFWNKRYYYLDIWIGREKISIPYTQDDYTLWDREWNADRKRQQNRLKSLAEQAQADELTEILGYKKSRRELIQEDVLIEAHIKKNFAKYNQDKIFAYLRSKGWKPGNERLEEEGKQLEENFQKGLISEEGYEKEKLDWQTRKDNYEKEVNKSKGKKSKTGGVRNNYIPNTPIQNKTEEKQTVPSLKNSTPITKKTENNSEPKKTRKRYPDFQSFITNHQEENGNNEDDDNEEKDPDDEGEN